MIALSVISLGIGKDVENLRRLFNSASKHVDAVYITLTGPRDQLADAEKVCQEFKANISYGDFLMPVTKKHVKWLKEFFGYAPNMKVGDKIFRFDYARNFNLSQIPKKYDWILWLDTDDVLRRGETIKNLCEMADKSDVEAIYANYLYQTDYVESEKPPEEWEIKNIIIEHIRERLIKNNDKFKWIAPIHETLIEQTPTRKTEVTDFDVMHLSSMEEMAKSLARNLSSLELAIYESDGHDPRHLYYLAKAYYDKRDSEFDKKAIPLILSYLYGEHKSGWAQERSQASEYLAELYRRQGQMNNAIKAAMNAMIEYPQNPMIYLNLATTYVMQKNWETAIFWVRMASVVPEPQTTLVKNPRDVKGLALEILFNCASGMGNVDEMWAAASKMKELMPNDSIINQMYENAAQLKDQRDISKIVLTLSDYLKKSGEYHKIKPLLASVPAISEQVPAVIDLKKKNNPPKFWGDKEIAIYCGPGFTTWSPKQLNDPGGSFVGGSEEAVIRMSSALTSLGYRVTVYNDPGFDEGDHDGVTYLPYYKFNGFDKFNVIIAWRQPKFFENELTAKKKYVWLHDIQNPLDYTDEAIKNTDKFIFLSRWHRGNVEKLPDEKVFVTSNGI